MIRRATLVPVFALAMIASGAAPAAAQDWSAPGVTVDDARAWLLENGGEVAVPEADGSATTLRVSDILPWTLSFYRCDGACADMQYTARFSGPGVTQDWVNAWNREHRYLKAWYAPASAEGGEATVVVQYDVALTGQGPAQLSQSTSIWKQQQIAFAQLLQGATRE